MAVTGAKMLFDLSLREKYRWLCRKYDWCFAWKLMLWKYFYIDISPIGLLISPQRG